MLGRSLAFLAALACYVSQAARSAPPEDAIAWFGTAPRTLTTTYKIDCDGAAYSLTLVENKSKGIGIREFSQGGQPVADEVRSSLGRIIDSFDRIDSTDFSCGDAVRWRDGKDYNFKGELSVSLVGRSKNEPTTAAEECDAAQGYYDDTTTGSVTVSKDRVVSIHEPDSGICFTEITVTEIPRPQDD